MFLYNLEACPEYTVLQTCADNMYCYESLYFMSNKISFLFMGLNFAINPASVLCTFSLPRWPSWLKHDGQQILNVN